MKLTILCVGKARTAFLEPAIADYLQRMRRWVTVSFVVLPALDKEVESAKLLSWIGSEDTVVLLDETGKSWSTPEFSAHIERWQNESTRSVVFVVGGAFGVNEAVFARADYVWSLSRLVFPHELVRLVLIEQLYRAYDLMHGGKYHHA